MRAAMESTYVAKFDHPYTAWLYNVSLDGCDEELGSVDELGCWIGQLGRHVLVEDSNGAVYSFRPLVDRQASTFYAWAREWLGSDRFDAYMAGGDDE